MVDEDEKGLLKNQLGQTIMVGRVIFPELHQKLSVDGVSPELGAQIVCTGHQSDPKTVL